MASAKTKACPCFSGEKYAACCGPLHDGTRAAETPARLMRSRYAAFALGEGAYLVDTLAQGHESLAEPRESLERDLRRTRETHRYTGLTIVAAPTPAEGDATAKVLFVAKVFEKGRDLSFAELSTFVREDGAWRYASGLMIPKDALPSDLGALDLTSFERLHGEFLRARAAALTTRR